MVIEQPTAADCEDLSELALRSKAVWGYDAEFIEACRAELTITPERLDTEIIRVARAVDRSILGFVSVQIDGETADLADLFVEPGEIGKGVGRRLLDTAVGLARDAGASRMRIEADPNAESWYLARGAIRIGEAPSGSIAGRMLPLLELDLVSG